MGSLRLRGGVEALQSSDGPRGVGHGFPHQHHLQPEGRRTRTGEKPRRENGNPNKKNCRGLREARPDAGYDRRTRRQRRREERKERKTKRCHSVGTMGMRLVDHCRRGRNVRIGSGDRIVAHRAIRRVIQLTSARRRSEGPPEGKIAQVTRVRRKAETDLMEAKEEGRVRNRSRSWTRRSRQRQGSFFSCITSQDREISWELRPSSSKETRL